MFNLSGRLCVLGDDHYQRQIELQQAAARQRVIDLQEASSETRREGRERAAADLNDARNSETRRDGTERAAADLNDNVDDSADVPPGPQLETVRRSRESLGLQRRNTAPPLFSGFLNGNKTAIRSSSFATALVSILQNADLLYIFICCNI